MDVGEPLPGLDVAEQARRAQLRVERAEPQQFGPGESGSAQDGHVDHAEAYA
jgi:hypothetical protein